MTSFQSSELTELPVVENSQLFAQRARSARYAPYASVCLCEFRLRTKTLRLRMRIRCAGFWSSPMHLDRVMASHGRDGIF